ncbi:HAD-IA family hydrolase [Synechococcus sp. UW140]|uniref:HAD-IA family hydrolase n=1 Tax=Synechococcus sp. UW140 TaxID=368503 RepID=UPI0031378288
MMPRLQALLWDVDGTLADTEQNGHRLAFNAAFAEAQLAWHWNNSTYSDLLAVTGGIERMRAWAKQQHLKSNQNKSKNQSDPLAESELEELLIRLQASKQKHYRRILKEQLFPLRPGVERLLLEARAAGLCQVLVTSSGRNSVEALLQHHPQLNNCWQHWICAEDVQTKKPHPEAYVLALKKLGLPASAAMAIEDSAQGLAAARGAGLKVLITAKAKPGLEGAAAIVDDLDAGAINLAKLQQFVD